MKLAAAASAGSFRREIHARSLRRARDVGGNKIRRLQHLFNEITSVAECALGFSRRVTADRQQRKSMCALCKQ